MKNTGRTHFKGKGLGTTDKQRPVSVKLPPEIDNIVRSLPNRSEFLRQAIAEKLKRDGLLAG
ncbi:MAG: ribbon-helix-helix domain-containing protein [Xenococcaceae cyanobacterium MO_188.B19]|nr:ribbon-helix-helix domain-containing protein [Xenococcaceae cyanobacterium MO_188.B19]